MSASPTKFDDHHDDKTDLDVETPQNSRKLEKQKILERSDTLGVPEKRVVFGKIRINDNISASNFYTYWLYVIYLGFIMISSSTLEPQFINKTLRVADHKLGSVTAALYLCDYGVRLVCALGYGLMIDHFGRKFVMTIGIILTSLGFLLIPFLSASLSLFPGYYLGKSVFSSGMIALQMLPLAADYVHNSTKGIMTGFTFGIGFFGGGLAACFVKGLLYFNFAYHTIYWILAGTIFVLGFTLRCGLKGGNQYYRMEKTDDQTTEAIAGGDSRWQEVRRAPRDTPWIPVAWMFGVLGDSGLYIMATGLVIWVKSLVLPTGDPTMLATTYQGPPPILSFIVTAILALGVDKVSHMGIIFPILLPPTMGFTAVPPIHNPRGAVMIVPPCLGGVTLPGILVYSSYLPARHDPPRARGAIAGIPNGISFIGAMIILSLGGILHDKWGGGASPIIYWCPLPPTLLAASGIYMTRMRGKGAPKKNPPGTSADIGAPRPPGGGQLGQERGGLVCLSNAFKRQTSYEK